ncbi:hypothetical protein CYLTODRAFT_205031 [Cylindrobasidium torrendii FP15055 ss-10]|uniref:Uncharacterized protein n=1 Tax=Cylindrobasidium torrendii FP15055 ss-10 TaxID=1314674 RepID=A0A0D7AWW7_9AGAR|nr:hypothetical protein CYLTODRAFT_205031 [Cylindrobasidium torrendii FP15055 ss-10]
MAVLAPLDWQYPLATDMDGPANGRQRAAGAGPSAEQGSASGHGGHGGGQTHSPGYGAHLPPGYGPGYPINQQPQGGWTPSIAAPPFYPSFYQNGPGASPQYGPMQQQGYFDPQQLAAQWYQQMMMNAQQQQQQHQFPQHRGPPGPPPPNMFSTGFPSGTPPPPHRGMSVDAQQSAQQQQPYPGYHPYRRPTRQGSAQADGGGAPEQWRGSPVPTPPYGRPDASASSSSVNSTHSTRQRTNSNQSGKSGQNAAPSPNGSARSRNGSNSSSPQPPPSSRQIPPHSRSMSGSSQASNNSSRPAPAASASSPSSSSSSPVAASSTLRPARPSPLSQGNFTASEKRMSRDDSDLAAMMENPPSTGPRGSGIKGRLRRALSFNAAQTLKEEEGDDDVSIKASASKKPKAPINTTAPKLARGPESPADDVSTRAPSTVQTKKKSRSLFNYRMNASTDNISLSSTVSSASVMIRKLGSMGKLARRNSLAGITSLFKDKDKDKDGSGKKSKKKETSKGEASEASVTLATAELDRSSDWSSPEVAGLSPAAKLARQHTLKTNAEAAARAKEREAAAPKANGAAGVPTWDKNTSNRSSSPVKSASAVRISEDGTRVLVEEDEDESDDEHFTRQAGPSTHIEGWDDDDEEWDEGEGDGEEDMTIRQGIEQVALEDDAEEWDDPEPWATDVRRSVERVRRPAKGILKYAANFDQTKYMPDQPLPTRHRSNSYDAHPGQDAGPLAHIPPADPDHIDGVHRRPSSSSQHGSAAPPSLPPLSFDFDSTPLSLEKTDSPSVHQPAPEKATMPAMFSHANSSAPALSMTGTAPSLTHRAATAPHESKRLAFASNLSVYDTFSATVYDRRSEPATWSRLTPQLAQRIKEELNSFKMEEMEVHASSRIHTQFFV